MNLDHGSLPPELQSVSLQLKLYPPSEVEASDVVQKGADPNEYVAVEWQCPKMSFAGMSQTGEYLMQAWFLIPAGFLAHQAGPTILGPDGQPLLNPEKIQSAFFPYSLPVFRALIRKADLSEQVPLPPIKTEEKEDEQREK